MAQTSPDLTKAINRENDRLIKANTKELPKYDYPMNVITAAMMQRYARYGGRPENSGRWLHPGWKPGRTKAGRERYFWIRAAFVRARSGSQMGTFGPRESHHTAAWLVPCGGRRCERHAPHYAARKDVINAQKRAAYAARKNFSVYSSLNMEPKPVTMQSISNVKAFNCETLDGAKQQQLQSAHK